MVDNSRSATWIEVDAPALRHNLAAVKGLLQPQTKLMTVVKANAYGHGPEAASVLAGAGADMLAVTTLAEALEIRVAGTATTPMLVFSPLLEEQIPTAMVGRLTLTIGSIEDARLISRLAAPGIVTHVHLKVDTGMGRIGVLPDHALEVVKAVKDLPGIELEGIYTHFATAMERDLSGARQQFQVFRRVLRTLSEASVQPPLAHCANSAAVLQMPDSHLDMVRVGTLLYGQYPAPFLAGRLELKQTWRMRSRIVSLKDVPAGWSVGYGSEYRTSKASRLAVVPIGYADGFAIEVAARMRRTWPERLRTALKALRGPAQPFLQIGTHRAPVVGRIGMQMMTIDVTGIPGVEIGSTVEIPCRRVNSNPRLPRVLIEE